MTFLALSAAAAALPVTAYCAQEMREEVQTGNTSDQRGWVRKNGGTCYYGKGGRPVTGWKKIRKKWYFFHKKTKMMAVNTIAGDKKSGYWYVGSDGIRVNDRTVNKAVETVRACTKKGMTDEEKAEACFDYIARQCRYQHNSEKQSAGKMPSFAYRMYVTRRGNCYMSAAAVAYCAKVIGCPVRVTVGGQNASSTGHGWAEIRQGNKWYVYDASRQRWSYGRDLGGISWKKFYNIWKNTRYKVRRNVMYSLETADGKAVWKEITKK